MMGATVGAAVRVGGGGGGGCEDGTGGTSRLRLRVAVVAARHVHDVRVDEGVAGAAFGSHSTRSCDGRVRRGLVSCTGRGTRGRKTRDHGKSRLGGCGSWLRWSREPSGFRGPELPRRRRTWSHWQRRRARWWLRGTVPAGKSPQGACVTWRKAVNEHRSGEGWRKWATHAIV